MTDAYQARLAEQRAETAAQMRGIVDAAELERRDLSAAEDKQLRSLDGDYVRLSADLARLAKLDARTSPRDNAMRAALSGSPETRMNSESPEIRQLFAAALANPGQEQWGDFYLSPGYVENRTLGTGGTYIATQFADFCAQYQRTATPLLQVATVIERDNGAPFLVPRLTADPSTSGTITAEAAAISELDPTFSQVTISSWKYASITNYSAELAQDNSIGLAALIAKSAARELTNSVGQHFATGSGTSQPKGYIIAGTNGGTANGTAGNTSLDTFFGPADVVDLFYGLAAPYRANASFLVSTTALAKIRKFRSTQGDYILTPPLSAGGPELLLGKPIYEDPFLAAVGSASKSIAVGDFSSYIVTHVSPARVATSVDYKWSSDLISLRVIERYGGDLPDVSAIRYLISANT